MYKIFKREHVDEGDDGPAGRAALLPAGGLIHPIHPMNLIHPIHSINPIHPINPIHSINTGGVACLHHPLPHQPSVPFLFEII